MLEGLVQHDYPLTLQHVLRRMRTVNGGREVVTLLDAGGETKRATYAEVAERADRVASALKSLGIGEGDRVATFMWNRQEHLEIYVATPCMGAVLHTLNLRLFPDQLTYIVNHAEDKVIFVDDSVIPVLAKVAGDFETVEHFVVVGDGDASALPGNVLRYEELLAEQPGGFDYPELDDHRPPASATRAARRATRRASSTRTSRNVLHALGTMATDALGVSGNDRLLPIVPMFHANAWGLPVRGRHGRRRPDHARPVPAGRAARPADRDREGDDLRRACRRSGSTCCATPTSTSPTCRASPAWPAAASAVPRSLMEAFEERHGVRIIQAWGMTETSPLGSVAIPPAGREGEDAWNYRTSARAAVLARRGAHRRARGGRVPAVGRRVVGRAAGARAVGGERVLQRRGRRREVHRRRLAAHGRRRLDRPRTATSASATAPRTSSSPAASGSRRWTSRTS